ncbi:MAG TPA: ATP-binding cassette domain-containing protein [Deltaproteobacteria bacterium]|nr:ATP-binding cassette domain-containing protein [Deltaproteobacteria bacterium]
MNVEIVLECRGISHWFGSNRVLFDINLKIIRGEIVSLVGPSGCGKSTLLRAIIGTHPPCKGEVIMTSSVSGDARTVDGPGRDRGIVYQNYSLFPFLTARENVAIGLMLDQTSLAFRMFHFFKWRNLRKEHLVQADALLETLKLGKALHLYPHEMSGGMRQRVAIAQALIMKPEILLLDEPFGALDEATREELQKMLLTLYSENCAAKGRGEPPPYTIFIVTHELNEAIYVGDRIVALSQYWNWKEAGLKTSPGATIVYDKMAPVYLPEQARDFETFLSQRHKIRQTAFEPDQPVDRNENIQFWDEIKAGMGHGVLQ